MPRYCGSPAFSTPCKHESMICRDRPTREKIDTHKRDLSQFMCRPDLSVLYQSHVQTPVDRQPISLNSSRPCHTAEAHGISPPTAAPRGISAPCRPSRSRPACSEQPSLPLTTSRSPTHRHVSVGPASACGSKATPHREATDGAARRPCPCQLRCVRPSQPCRLSNGTQLPSTAVAVAVQALARTGGARHPSRCAVVKRCRER